MILQIGVWRYRNGNARRSARTVVQEHSVFRARISYDRGVCSHGRRGFLGLASVLEHAVMLSKGELDSRMQQEHERWCEWGVFVSVMGGR